MQYDQFELDFVRRTRAILEQYDAHVVPSVGAPERYEVTLLTNCLLGLIALPKQLLSAKIPSDPECRFGDWGLPDSVVKSWGNAAAGNDPSMHTLAEFVGRLRNGVCHLRLEVEAQNGEITALRFHDLNGFEALVPVDCLKNFVYKLSDVLLVA